MSDQPRANEPRNRLLSCLTCTDLALLQRYLEPVALKFRERLESANRKIKNAYFIEKGIASVVAVANGQHRQAEVAIVGREGMTGLAVVLGADRSPLETYVQVEGEGQCIAAADLRRAMAESGSLAQILLRYAHVFVVQASHSVLANAQGKIEERLARWLLMAHDRMDGNDLYITHEFLAVMLGVRRAGVTTALHQLESRALISMVRGNITIIDREGLEENANGLYGMPEAEFDRLFQSCLVS